MAGHRLLELGDLAQQTRDDVLGELVILLLLIEPGEVLVLHLQVVELLVEAVERPRVALLVDEALALLQCFGELLLLGAKGPDPLTLLLLLEACLLLLTIRFFLLLAPGLGHLGLTLLDHGLN